MTRSIDDLLGNDPETLADPLPVNDKRLGVLLGCSAPTVRTLTAQGVLVQCSKGRWDIADSVQRYVAHKLAVKRGDEDKARKLAADADLAEAKAQKIRGELLDAKEVETAWAAILRDIKAQMLAIPPRLEARLPHLGKEVSREADAAIREALTTLSKGGEIDPD